MARPYELFEVQRVFDENRPASSSPGKRVATGFVDVKASFL